MTSSAAAATPERATIDLGTTLANLSGELRQLSAQCTALQWSISTLLEKVDHPDLAAEIHMLQDVDRIQQTLTDIGSILAVAEPAGAGVAVDLDEVGTAIRLESLRRRLGLSGCAPGQDADVSEDGITWL